MHHKIPDIEYVISNIWEEFCALLKEPIKKAEWEVVPYKNAHIFTPTNLNKNFKIMVGEHRMTIYSPLYTTNEKAYQIWCAKA